MQAKPQKHILIVDDDQDLRELMTEVLVSEGYTVSSASDGQAGLDFLNACRVTQLPNLIILGSQIVPSHIIGNSVVPANLERLRG